MKKKKFKPIYEILFQKVLRDGNTYSKLIENLSLEDQLIIRTRLKKLHKDVLNLKEMEIDGEQKDSISDELTEDIHSLRALLPLTYVWRMERTIGNKKLLVEFKSDKSNTTNKMFKDLKKKIKNEIQEYRSYLKDVGYSTTKVPFLKDRYISKQNGTFIESGEILKLKEEKTIKNIYNDKSPTTEDLYIGVEFEFCSEATAINIAKELYKQNLLNYCTWHRDESLRPKNKEQKHEIAVLIKESELDIICKVCDVLNSMGAQTTERRCGLHVHFDMRHRNKEIAFNNLISCQRWLLKMVSKYRRNSEFCKTVKSKKFPKNLKNTREERYKTINAASYYKHKTLEIRLHEGTTNPDLVINWVKFLLKIVNYKTKLTTSMKSLNMLFMTFRINKMLRTYVHDRINEQKFNTMQEVELQTTPVVATENVAGLNIMSTSRYYVVSPASTAAPIPSYAGLSESLFDIPSSDPRETVRADRVVINEDTEIPF